MGKRGKNSDVTETKGNPVLRALKGNKEIDQSPERIAKDIEILDKGWNNTAEGQADLKSGRVPGINGKVGKGKHAK